MPDATAKYPTAAAALSDFYGEMTNFPEQVLSGAHNNSVTTITLTATVPTGWPTIGAVTIDSEQITYTGKSGATLTGCTRGAFSTVAASHADAAKVGMYLTARQVNQILAEIISLETQLLGGTLNPNLCLNSDFSRRTVFGLAMPEVFADLSGTTKIDGGAAGSVASNIFTQGAANNEYAWCAGSFVWRDGRASATFKAVAAAGTFALRWRIDANNFIAAHMNAGTFYIVKNIGGSTTTPYSTVQALTLNRWYWLELEKQGTTIIVKLYDTGGTVPGVTKASSTLLQTVTGTVADAGVQTGAHISIFGDTNATQWGGIATGNGGVYVETWLPESWTAAFTGTLGGQAVGYDESSDAGPIGTQNPPTSYIPAITRGITLTQGPTRAGTLNSLATYNHSFYVKNTGLGGSGVMARMRVNDRNTALGILNTRDADDAAETAWTRKTATPYGIAGTTFDAVIYINPSSTRTGTVRFSLGQVEQGSAATAWRASEKDAATRTTLLTNTSGDKTTTSATMVEVDSRDSAVNHFSPQDETLTIMAIGEWLNGGAGNNQQFAIYVDGAAVPGTRVFNMTAPGASYSVALCAIVITRVAAGKHRIAANWDVAAGTATVRATTTNPLTLAISASAGK